MRILMLGVKEYPYGIGAQFEKFPGGGTGKYVIPLSEGLVGKGHTVDLIVRRMPRQAKFEVDKGINIHRVAWINNRYLRLPSFNLCAFFRALTFAKDVDVIHTHGSFAAIYGVTLGKLFRKPMIGTTHGLTSDQVKNKYKSFAVKGTRWLEKFGYSHLDKIAFLSEAEQKMVCEKLVIKPKSSVLIYPGIRPMNIKRRKSKFFKVVFIGRLVEQKGLDKLIKSFPLLPKKMQDKTQYIIVGDGYLKPQLERLTKDLKLEDKVIFTGYTNNVGKYLEDASIFILPSEGGEGLPCALLEAMSAGIVCVVSNFEAPLRHEAFTTLKDNNPKTIADRIVELNKQPNVIEVIANHAKDEFNEKFNYDIFIKNYEEQYLFLFKS